MIGLVGVVVPARDEEVALPACLAALEVAVDTVRAARPGVGTTVVVVLDRCLDASAAVVAARPAVTAVVSQAGRVGAARAQGARRVLADSSALGLGPDQVWLASTDADSTVPADWLLTQVLLHEQGADAVVGTITVADWTEHPVSVRDSWLRGYSAVAGHGHVHGANLGVTGAAYLAVGGFPNLTEHEDVALVTALSQRHAVARTASSPVTTSARRVNRADGGFAGYLRGTA